VNQRGQVFLEILALFFGKRLEHRRPGRHDRNRKFFWNRLTERLRGPFAVRRQPGFQVSLPAPPITADGP
jgi:hypothetical protein